MSNEEIELLTCVLASYMRHGGKCLDELQEAVQDCGLTDRQIHDMMCQAIIKRDEEIDKS